MMISIEIILLNLYYCGVAVALLIRDILWLRIILVISGLFLITYGTISDNPTVILWNSLFVSINIFQIVMLILQRKPVHIGQDLMPLYEKVFSSMRKKDFLYLWKKGHVVKGEKKVLCRCGVPQENLFLILDGEAKVIKKGKKVSTLTWGSFVAELAFFTGKKASADVISKGTISYIYWSHGTIHRIKSKHGEMYEKLHQILTADISEKLSKSGT